MFHVGQKVSFVHEGAGYRIFGEVISVNGASLTVRANNREYEVDVDLDQVEHL